MDGIAETLAKLLPRVKRRNYLVAFAAILAVAGHRWPAAVYGRESYKRGDHPQTWAAHRAYWARKLRVEEKQIDYFNGNHGVRVEKQKLEAEDRPEDPHDAAVVALRRGGTLANAAEYSGVLYGDICESWAAAENGDDDDFGRRMREAKATYDLDITATPSSRKAAAGSPRSADGGRQPPRNRPKRPSTTSPANWM